MIKRMRRELMMIITMTFDKEEDDVSVVQAGPWLRIMHTVLQVSGMPARI